PVRHGDDYPGAQVFIRNAAQRAYVGEQDLVEVGRSSDQVGQERCIPLSKAEVAKLAPGCVSGGCAETLEMDHLLDPERDIACDLAAPSLEVPAKQGSAERCPRLAALGGVEFVDRERLRPERVDLGRPEVSDEGVISGSALPRNPRDALELMGCHEHGPVCDVHRPAQQAARLLPAKDQHAMHAEGVTVVSVAAGAGGMALMMHHVALLSVQGPAGTDPRGFQGCGRCQHESLQLIQLAPTVCATLAPFYPYFALV